jgi:hypothetical protein
MKLLLDTHIILWAAGMPVDILPALKGRGFQRQVALSRHP